MSYTPNPSTNLSYPTYDSGQNSFTGNETREPSNQTQSPVGGTSYDPVADMAAALDHQRRYGPQQLEDDKRFAKRDEEEIQKRKENQQKERVERARLNREEREREASKIWKDQEDFERDHPELAGDAAWKK